jgi:hypothetical protein
MTRVTKPTVDVASTPTAAPVAAPEVKLVEKPATRTTDASDSIPTLRLHYL